jgi:hypothetical protein
MFGGTGTASSNTLSVLTVASRERLGQYREIHEFAAHCTVKGSAASFFCHVRRGRKWRSFMKLIERIAVVVSAFFVVLGLAASPRLRLDLDSVPREGED